MDKRTNKSKISTAQILISTILFSVIYVVLRYHIFGNVPWKDFPFFILNKWISLSAFILLTYNFSIGPLGNMGINIPKNWLDARNLFGITGFLLVIIHGLISLLLFKPIIYAKFFDADGTLTLFAGLSMLSGILAFVVLWVYNLSFQTYLRENQEFIKFITSRTFFLWSLTLGAWHLFFMGITGWINPSDWHGGMPPVSLIAFSFFFFGYIINILGRK